MRMNWPPFRSTRSVVRQLKQRGNAAREGRRWQAAAALFEEALAIGGRDGRLHIQCGHMFKEAGDYRRAADHYRAASQLLPDDADLALQLGHFHKTVNEPAEAEQAYARALALRPDWDEATRELRGLRGSAGAAPAPVDGARPLLPELLPDAAAPPVDDRERLVVERLGAELAPGPGGTARVLRGVQAIRGWCWSDQALTTVCMAVNGVEIRREPIAAVPGQPRKYVFNLWHDFSTMAEGEAQVEVRLLDGRGRARSHRALVRIEAPQASPAYLASDAYIPPLPGRQPLDAEVNALPSVVRPARRSPFARPRAVLVQRVDQLGDLVCSVPAIRRLRALFPETRLVGLVSPANADLARSLQLFDAVVVADFPESEGRRTMAAAAQQALAQDLASFPFDLAIDLSEGVDSRPLLLLSGAPFLVGFGRQRFPWLSLALELTAPDPLDRLETTAHGRKVSALVEALAAAVEERAVAVPRPDDEPEKAALQHRGLAPSGYILLHTGARLPFSRWPGFSALARRLLAGTDKIVVLMHEADDPPTDLPSDPRLQVIGGRLPFPEFDALVAGAALFVGNDSGPKHLAALRGVPVVSLHMARLNWNEWGQEQGGLIVSRRVPCAGCGIAADPDECGRDFACLRLISPDEVLAAALSLLDG